ncbi:DinB family protein [Angustibacter luteus]|uniref:DinB family protein n=1 Tax=Angustibacter luteus TaxID=658456 RepID=A0ABW1JE44_9ACTN
MSATTKTDTLQSWLEGQRRHVLGILEGLDDDALRRPVLPSGWSCLGLVQHLALDVERFWFRGVVAGDPDVVAAIERDDDAWQVDAAVPSHAVLDRYRAEIALADDVIAATSPGAAPRWWPQGPGDWRLADRDEVLLHVITETACHAGHLDAARELVDGRQWLVLDG